MIQETTSETINRYQQQLDRIDDQIQSKHNRIIRFKFDGPVLRTIEREIIILQERREMIAKSILQLKLTINKPLKATT
jgi:hypothetical protein